MKDFMTDLFDSQAVWFTLNTVALEFIVWLLECRIIVSLTVRSP